MSLNVLVARIQHMENRHVLKYSSKDIEEALFVKTKRYSRPSSDTRGSTVVCHYCGKWGHYLSQSRERESDIKTLDDDRCHKFQKHSANVAEETPYEILNQAREL